MRSVGEYRKEVEAAIFRNIIEEYSPKVKVVAIHN
jgi:hypothetical protein